MYLQRIYGITKLNEFTENVSFLGPRTSSQSLKMRARAINKLECKQVDILTGGVQGIQCRGKVLPWCSRD